MSIKNKSHLKEGEKMQKKLTKRNEQTGFTIIEVVLVLAIAGLIFLIVFLALPQLQRSRRDTQRKSDAGRLLSAVESYSGNNNGAYPAGDVFTYAGLVTTYLTANGGVWNDPKVGGAAYSWSADNTPEEGYMAYRPGEICAGQASTTTGATARSVSVLVFQESGGQYCQDNQ